MATRLGLPFLGEVPITMALRENSDTGNPSANFEAGSPLASALQAMVESVEKQASLVAVRLGQQRPTLSIS
jgi:ATP-binding protein involved in chromosome partitioning